MPKDRGRRVAALMFAATALLWGSSAIVTTTQAVAVPAALSVAWRMLIVFAVMLALAAATRTRLRLEAPDVPFVALQGVLFFGLNFVAFYEATRLVPSGIAALVLSTSAIVAALLARLFLKAPLSWRVLAGLACGVSGLGLVFAPELARLDTGASGSLAGLGFAFVAAASTAAGTVVGARNQARGLPTLATMTWGALAGAAFAGAWAGATADRPIVLFDPSTAYVAGLLHLALAASCLAFLMYFALVRRLGPARAAYTLALAPLVAIVASALFEGLEPTPLVVLGTAVIVGGNVLVLGADASRKAPTEPAGGAPGRRVATLPPTTTLGAGARSPL
ncbi:DMT family transporter [Salinarimonas sp. NSM]|uniref:DMT family transporter n=1 Tax=Salinarimonas sp. NSM TaxID=3458003 RepID=UPI004035AE81